MLKITIEAGDKLTEISGVAKATGKPYSIRRQPAYMWTGKAHPVPIEINLGDTTPPYPAGDYTFGPSSYKLGQKGPELDSYNLVLEPLRAAAPRPGQS